MAAVASLYPLSQYHQQSYFGRNLTSFHGAPHIPNNSYKPKPQKQQKEPVQPQPLTPNKTAELIDAVSQQLRPRREPRIRRQVILLPSPKPIYRQVRHRLPTPERQVIQRTIIQKGNGEVIVQQQRHAKKARSQSSSGATTQARLSRT